MCKKRLRRWGVDQSCHQFYDVGFGAGMLSRSRGAVIWDNGTEGGLPAVRCILTLNGRRCRLRPSRYLQTLHATLEIFFGSFAKGVGLVMAKGIFSHQPPVPSQSSLPVPIFIVSHGPAAAGPVSCFSDEGVKSLLRAGRFDIGLLRGVPCR